MWRAIEDAAIFEDNKDDDSEDDSISKIRRDAGGKTKKSVPRKKTNISSITELNNEDNSDDASPKAKVGGRRVKSKTLVVVRNWRAVVTKRKKIIAQTIITQVSEQRVTLEKPRRQLAAELWPIVATIFQLLSPICWALLQPSLDEPAILTITPQSWERSS